MRATLLQYDLLCRGEKETENRKRKTVIRSTGQRCTSCVVGGCQQRLTRLRVESAGVEEVGGEVDVDITEEKQHVASLPGSRPHVQTPSPRKLLVQLQQSVVLKINFPADTRDKEGIIKNKGSLFKLQREAERERVLQAHFMEDYKYIFTLSLYSLRSNLAVSVCISQMSLYISLISTQLFNFLSSTYSIWPVFKLESSYHSRFSPYVFAF